MWWLESAKTLSVKGIFIRDKTTTFQSNGAVIHKLIWLELDRNPSNTSFEKSSPDGQGGNTVSPNIPVRKESASESDYTASGQTCQGPKGQGRLA
jgi:hypothetical protein